MYLIHNYFSLGSGLGSIVTDLIEMLRRVFKLSTMSADLESWRAISKDPSRINI